MMRVFSAAAIAVLIAALLPFPVFAAVPTITIKEIKSGESVTVQGTNFPKYIDFTVRMDKTGNYAIGGIVVGTIHSGNGSFEGTFQIPSSLKDQAEIAIRMDGAGGWYSYNWFENKKSSGGGQTTPTPTPGTGTSTKPRIDVIGVLANDRITVQAKNFPANQIFRIRIGTFANFFRDYVYVGTVDSGKGGDFQFTVDLPAMKAGVDRFTIRLDSAQKYYAYNVFKNVTSGVTGTTTPPTSGTSTPIAGSCQITSKQPTGTLAKNADFDAVWTVKNTGSATWYLDEVDYRYVSGSRIHKYNDVYDLSKTVKPGESITIRVDMTAPSTAGTYAVNWAIVRSNTTLCTLPLTITVK
ncbi:MAG: NBR1-Ig-like domain-containing protein [Anaerolineaceae bacterium]